MEIVFFRHGNALSLSEAGVSSDAERPLSEKGEEEVTASAANLERENFAPEIIISSPLKRAGQTAAIISRRFKTEEVRFLNSLASSSDIGSILKSVIELSAGKNALIVGHQPTLNILARLISGEEELDLRTAGYALIELEAPDKPAGKLKSNFNL